MKPLSEDQVELIVAAVLGALFGILLAIRWKMDGSA